MGWSESEGQAETLIVVKLFAQRRPLMRISADEKRNEIREQALCVAHRREHDDYKRLASFVIDLSRDKK